MDLRNCLTISTLFDKGDLTNSNLEGATVNGAIFLNAKLQGAIMNCKGLESSKLEGATFDATTIWPDQFNALKYECIKI